MFYMYVIFSIIQFTFTIFIIIFSKNILRKCRCIIAKKDIYIYIISITFCRHSCIDFFQITVSSFNNDGLKELNKFCKNGT